MTTDAFTEAARAEAELKHPVPDAYDPRVSQYERLLAQGAFRAGAEWARDHLAAQEPTEEEVEAAAIEAYEMERADIDPAWPDWQDAGPLSRDSTRAMVRAIFRAAKEARR